MKLLHLSFAALGLVISLSSGFAQEKAADEPRSPALPPPKWLKVVDQGASDARLKGYMAPAGVKVEIIAEHPVVTNPVGISFADDGTLHVLEWRPDPNAKQQTETITYKDGSKHTSVTMKRTVKDVIKVLTDSQGKGVYDQAKVLLEEELPSSVLFHDGWLYVTGQGTVRRYKQSEAGGPYDNKEVIAREFGGVYHSQVSGLTLGNDGWLYITAGDADHHVVGSDSRRATVLRTGAVFRCRPDGSKMQVFALGFCNPYRDVAFDNAFNMFQVDNDRSKTGKFAGCRLMHVAEESDFGWRRRADSHAIDANRAADAGELPGKMPPLLKTGPGGPAGLLIYNEAYFPEHFRGLIYYPDVVRKLIRAYKVEPRDSTFKAIEEFEFLKSDDPLFRPCQMVAGPDGAIYVCDWRSDKFDADGKQGRIYRITWAGTDDHAAVEYRAKDSWAAIAKQSDEELLKTLASPNFSDRQRAQRKLVHHGERHRKALMQALDDTDLPAEAHIAAAGALQAFWNEDVEDLFISLMRAKDVGVRRLAVEYLALNAKPKDAKVSEALIRNLEEAEPSVRRAMYLALGRTGSAEAVDSLINAFKAESPKDVYLFDGLLRAIERLGKPGIEGLVAVSESGVDADRDKVYDAFLSLRTRPAAEAIPRLMKYPHLSIKQRSDLLRSYGNYLLDPPIAYEPLLDYAEKHPDEPPPVKIAVLEALQGTTLFSDEKTKVRCEKLAVSCLDTDNADLQKVAVTVLGQQPEGAKIVGERLAAKKLPRELQPQVVAALRKHADKDKDIARILDEILKDGK